MRKASLSKLLDNLALDPSTEYTCAYLGDLLQLLGRNMLCGFEHYDSRVTFAGIVW